MSIQRLWECQPLIIIHFIRWRRKKNTFVAFKWMNEDVSWILLLPSCCCASPFSVFLHNGNDYANEVVNKLAIISMELLRAFLLHLQHPALPFWIITSNVCIQSQPIWCVQGHGMMPQTVRMTINKFVRQQIEPKIASYFEYAPMSETPVVCTRLNKMDQLMGVIYLEVCRSCELRQKSDNG